MAETAQSYTEYEWKGDLSYGVQVLYGTLRSLLDPERNRRILDLGCGNGALSRKLTAEGFEVWGVDASVSGIERANRHMPGRFHVVDISHRRLPAPLQEIEFDTVISTEVIEHLYAPHDLLKLAATVFEGRPGGELLITTPYHGYLKNLVIALTGKFDGHVDALTTGGHIKFFSRASLSRALEQSGFRVTQFRGAGRLPYLWKGMVLKAVPTGS